LGKLKIRSGSGRWQGHLKTSELDWDGKERSWNAQFNGKIPARPVSWDGGEGRRGKRKKKRGGKKIKARKVFRREKRCGKRSKHL